MFGLRFDSRSDQTLKVLLLGAHSDDIEIGCGGLLRQLSTSIPQIEVRCIVFSASEIRARETRSALSRLTSSGTEDSPGSASIADVRCEAFRDGFFFDEAARIKELFESLKQESSPDLILTHHGRDAHQDHRVVSELTWNTFRSHTILEYEIPKYDGDTGNPNLFVPMTRADALQKADIIYQSFESQQHRNWFDKDTFMSLARLRGVQCDAPEGFAEAFYGKKLWLNT